jgi:glutathione S-transferase
MESVSTVHRDGERLARPHTFKFQMLCEYFLGSNKFIGGEAPCIADMAIAPTLYFLAIAKFEAS